jgi:hypothetical protein
MPVGFFIGKMRIDKTSHRKILLNKEHNMSIINPYTVMIGFATILAALAYFRPAIARAISGIFFLVMAFGVNVPMAAHSPEMFSAAGASALLPIYRWFFSEVLGRAPLPFVILLILFETSVGLLILSRGRLVRLGLGAACLFLLFLIPVGVEELAVPALSVPFLMLMRVEFNQPVWGG